MQINVDGRAVELKDGSTVLDALKKLSLNPEIFIVSRKDEIIHENEEVKANDSLTLIKVISGG